MTELDHTPKDTEEFGTRVAELHKVFQQHVRDEKKELLPAVLQALTDEEAETVIENIQAGKAEIEEAKRAEAEERRDQARREREKAQAEQARIDAAKRTEAQERRAAARIERDEAERVQQAAETVVNAAWAGPRTAERAAKTAQQAVQTGLSTASEVAQRASQNLESFAQSGTALARGMQDVSSECLSMVQERMQKNLDGINAVVRSRTLPELMAAQSLLFRENLELTISNSRRIVELSTRIADTTTRTATARGGMHAG